MTVTFLSERTRWQQVPFDADAAAELFAHFADEKIAATFDSIDRVPDEVTLRFCAKSVENGGQAEDSDEVEIVIKPSSIEVRKAW